MQKKSLARILWTFIVLKTSIFSAMICEFWRAVGKFCFTVSGQIQLNQFHFECIEPVFTVQAICVLLIGSKSRTIHLARVNCRDAPSVARVDLPSVESRNVNCIYWKINWLFFAAIFATLPAIESDRNSSNNKKNMKKSSWVPMQYYYTQSKVAIIISDIIVSNLQCQTFPDQHPNSRKHLNQSITS